MAGLADLLGEEMNTHRPCGPIPRVLISSPWVLGLPSVLGWLLYLLPHPTAHTPVGLAEPGWGLSCSGPGRLNLTTGNTLGPDKSRLREADLYLPGCLAAPTASTPGMPGAPLPLPTPHDYDRQKCHHAAKCPWGANSPPR